MDILDIYNGRFYQTYSGRYFRRLPESITFLRSVEDLYKVEDGEDFDYEFVDPTSWNYKKLFGNLTELEYANASIKSRDALDWKVKGYVVLEDGRLYIISFVAEDTMAAEREAARLMPIPVGTEYILRLVEVENPAEV